MKVLNDLLGYKDMKIYQDDQYFRFSIDGVMLANFVKLRLTDKKILDIGTGTGIIPLILSTRTDKKIEAIEIQKDLCDLFLDTIKFNSLEDRIQLICDDVRNFSKNPCYLNQYHVVISNPPYYNGKKNKTVQATIARNQEMLNLDSLLDCSRRLLKNHGSLFLVYDSSQFEYLVDKFSQYNFCIKSVQFVYDTIESNSSICLIHAIKNGSYGMKILSPFILHDNNRNKTFQYEKLFSEK